MGFRYTFFSVVLLLQFAVTGFTQETGWRNWLSANASYAINKDWRVSAGHLRSYEISNKYVNSFNQFRLSTSYDITKRFGIGGGVQWMTLPSSPGTRTRVYLNADHTTRIARKINWTNSLQVETNSSAEKRFRQRVILGTRLAPRKRLDFLNLSPSVSYRLFYNIGGNPISYYDAEGNLLARQSPDGFHRHRLQLNANSKISDLFRINLYFMMQREFNFLSPETRKINIPNRTKTSTIRPFDNYNVIGLSLNLDINELIK